MAADRYEPVRASIWRQLRPLGDAEKLVVLNLWTSRSRIPIPGVGVGGPATHAEEIGGAWTSQAVRDAVEKAIAAGYPLAVDWEAPLVWLEEALEAQPPRTAAEVAHWANSWPLIAPCELRSELRQALAISVEPFLGKPINRRSRLPDDVDQLFPVGPPRGPRGGLKGAAGGLEGDRRLRTYPIQSFPLRSESAARARTPDVDQVLGEFSAARQRVADAVGEQAMGLSVRVRLDLLEAIEAGQPSARDVSAAVEELEAAGRRAGTLAPISVEALCTRLRAPAPLRAEMRIVRDDQVDGEREGGVA